MILVGIAVLFEIAGWIVKGVSFQMNPQRLFIILLQASIIGLLAIAVTQVIITGGIDLSSVRSLPFPPWLRPVLQTPENTRAVYPALDQSSFYHSIGGGVTRRDSCGAN